MKPGTVIAQYEIVTALGDGGMGVVYRARDLKLDRDVALKFLPPELSRDEEANERFTQEARAASALNHPNVCVLHDIKETEDGRLYIVMPWYDGQTLKYRLSSGPMDHEAAVNIVRQVAEGLRAAHRKGIVHRDIKPANIMVTDDGRAIILDFGLAKLTGGLDLTQAGSTMGTAHYMSPEQTRGGEVDHRTDLWSLGVVLYQMLAGARPFEGTYQQSIAYGIVHSKVEPIDELPEGLWSVVERLLRKDPAERFQSAAEVAEALDGFAGRTVSEQSVQGANNEMPTSRKWIAAAVAAALLIAVVLGFMYWPIGPPPVASEQGVVDEPAASDRQRLIVLPFENLGSAEDQYFADGITEEITMRLASLKDLGVISRNTAVRVSELGKSTSEIGTELQVDYVLEGTVRWAHQPDGSSLVRITPQLIRVNDDTHVWADSYEERIENIFEIQKQVAERVAEQLHVALGSGGGQFAEAPTTNVEAYGYYLKALSRERSSDWAFETIEEAVADLERALELDPLYLDAAVLLARMAAWQSWRTLGTVQRDYAEKARAAMERAAMIQPGSPEAATAAGYYFYYIDQDYQKARVEFRKALAEQSEHAEAREALAIIESRLGNYEESIRLYRELLSTDPLNSGLRFDLSVRLRFLHRYEDAYAEGLKGRAVEDSYAGNCMLARLAIQLDRSTVRAKRHQEDARRNGDRCTVVETHERRFDDALAIYDTLDVPAEPTSAGYFYMDRAFLNRAANRAHAERADWGRLLELSDSIVGAAETTSLSAAQGYLFKVLAYAGLGDRSEALDAIRVLRVFVAHDLQLTDASGEAFVYAYILLGMADEALDELEKSFVEPSHVMPADLTTAIYDPIRDHPRFQALVAEHPWP